MYVRLIFILSHNKKDVQQLIKFFNLFQLFIVIAA